MNAPVGEFTSIPNYFFDKYLGTLTAAEFKVLCYIARRTLGFHQDSARVSVAQFASGLLDKDTGTGLALSAIRTALASLQTLKIVEQVSPRDPRQNLAAEWRILELSPEQDEALATRAADQAEARCKRTEKATRSRRHPPTSDVAPSYVPRMTIVRPTYDHATSDVAWSLSPDDIGYIVPNHPTSDVVPSYVPRTDPPTSDVDPYRNKEERKILGTSDEVPAAEPKPKSKPALKGAKPNLPPGSEPPPVRPPSPRNLVSNAIAYHAYKMKKGDTFTSVMAANVIAHELPENPTPDEITALAARLTKMYLWYGREHADLDPPAKAPSIIKYLAEFKESEESQNGRNARTHNGKESYSF